MRRHSVIGFDFRNLSKWNVVRATAALVELNSDWLNRFTRNPGQRRFAELFLPKLIKWTVNLFKMSFIVVEAIR